MSGTTKRPSTIVLNIPEVASFGQSAYSKDGNYLVTFSKTVTEGEARQLIQTALSDFEHECELYENPEDKGVKLALGIPEL